MGDGANHAESASMKFAWEPASRVVTVWCKPAATLTGDDGRVLVEALTRWVRDDDRPFALLVDVEGVAGTNAAYRATARPFFVANRERVFVAVLHMGRVVRVIAEMFRVGTGIQLKGFDDEVSARAWLRSRGIAA